MAKVPATKSSSSSALSRFGTGPTLMGTGVGLFVVTRVVKWLPLGFLGSWINGFLWPILILCLVGGAGLTYLKSKRGS